jgi:3-oxoacyl-[acyl-carrier protein] reductase
MVMIRDTDFTGQRVLVVGGSSGIGNGIAHAFRERGAEVHVWGTRANAADYDPADGSDLTGLGYTCVDVGDPDAIEAAPLPLASLDVLVLCQGTVVYKRGEFERAGLGPGDGGQPRQPDALARKFKPAQLPRQTQGQRDCRQLDRRAGQGSNIGNPAYAASKAGAISLTKTLGRPGRPKASASTAWRPGWSIPS